MEVFTIFAMVLLVPVRVGRSLVFLFSWSATFGDSQPCPSVHPSTPGPASDKLGIVGGGVLTATAEEFPEYYAGGYAYVEGVDA